VEVPELNLEEFGLEPAAVGAGLPYLVGEVAASEDEGDGSGFSKCGGSIPMVGNLRMTINHNGIGDWRISISDRAQKMKRMEISHCLFNIIYFLSF
jgi:hypothetical protein